MTDPRTIAGPSGAMLETRSCRLITLHGDVPSATVGSYLSKTSTPRMLRESLIAWYPSLIPSRG